MSCDDMKDIHKDSYCLILLYSGKVRLETCESAIFVRIESRIESAATIRI